LAKHCGLVLNVAFLVATVALLQSLTNLPLRRIVTVTALSIPLNKNFYMGNTTFCSYLSWHLGAGVMYAKSIFFQVFLIGIGFGLRIFPILYLG